MPESLGPNVPGLSRGHLVALWLDGSTIKPGVVLRVIVGAVFADMSATSAVALSDDMNHGHAQDRTPQTAKSGWVPPCRTVTSAACATTWCRCIASHRSTRHHNHRHQIPEAQPTPLTQIKTVAGLALIFSDSNVEF